MSSFLLITIAWQKTPLTMENVEKIDVALGHFGEWFRISGTAWMLVTELNEHVLYGALKTQLTAEDFFMITSFDPTTYAGWGPVEIDEWIKARRQKLTS